MKKMKKKRVMKNKLNELVYFLCVQRNNLNLSGIVYYSTFILKRRNLSFIFFLI